MAGAVLRKRAYNNVMISLLTTLQHALPLLFDKSGVNALWIPSCDAHLNEYLLPDSKRREWLTGFTGSAGDALVTADAAWVFVDSRYHVQVDTEVDCTQWTIQKLGLSGVESLHGVVTGLAQGHTSYTVGVDATCVPAQQAEALRKVLATLGGKLVPVAPKAIAELFAEAAPNNLPLLAPVISLPDRVTGQRFADKQQSLLTAMAQQGANALPVVRLDHLAWLLNWRGGDVPYNPLFKAYGLLTAQGLTLYADHPDLPTLPAGVTVAPYSQFAVDLSATSSQYQWLLDVAHIDWNTLQAIPTAQRVMGPTPIAMAKALKNPAEQSAMRVANLSASVALTHGLAWLSAQVQAGQPVSEASFAHQLEAFYAEQPEYAGQSFNTIAGVGANGAIVHYGTPNPQAMLVPDQLFLVDSGAQYLGGTTDATRTVMIGTPAHKHKHAYTAVLKAHIALSGCVFPEGTNGAQLDGVTRAPMWQLGVDYGHGTGHGVGAGLCVHEGPNGIHKAASTVFKPGMVTSIEPGFYESGWGGIRLENLALCLPAPNQSGWLVFDPLIWVPFDPQLVEFDTLTTAERAWLADYHQQVWQRLQGRVNANYLPWLKQACQSFDSRI
jgi:Xaa-Pro aminopeptidase